MFADVSATNVPASRQQRFLAALDDPTQLRHLLQARCLVLRAFIAPACTLIAWILDIGEHRVMLALATTVYVAVVPLGALGIATWVGVRYPYNVRTLRWRWQHRKDHHRQTAWVLLASAPWLIVPTASLLIMAPALLTWTLLAPPTTHSAPASAGSTSASPSCASTPHSPGIEASRSPPDGPPAANTHSPTTSPIQTKDDHQPTSRHCSQATDHGHVAAPDVTNDRTEAMQPTE